MTDFERAVLTILADAGEPLGWYSIERSLSNRTLGERPNLLEVLGRLRDAGLVEPRSAASDPSVRYELTRAGASALKDAR
jgi:DNA-binding PadR family transcriptional regulator